MKDTIIIVSERDLIEIMKGVLSDIINTTIIPLIPKQRTNQDKVI